MNQLPPGKPQDTLERPLLIRASIAGFGLIIVWMTFKQWQALPPEHDVNRFVLLGLPLLLAGSMFLQFFAMRRKSALMALSLGLSLLVIATWVLLRN